MQYAYFFFYSLVRSLYTKRLTRLGGGKGGGPRAIGTIEELVLGALAGAGAQVFTIPVAVIGQSSGRDTRDVEMRGGQTGG